MLRTTTTTTQPTQSPRAVAHDDSVSLPASHGRRLMQMIFRSNHEDESTTPVREAVVLTSPVAGRSVYDDARSEDDSVPVGSNKLRALKRKLFPSRKRRHPVRIPPLVVSPIHAQSVETSHGNNNHEERFVTPEETEQPVVPGGVAEEQEDHEEAELWRGGDDDIDDDLLEAIEEADRLQSTTSDETIAQMSRAIDELHQWKARQELVTQAALKDMEENAAIDTVALAASVDDEADEAARREAIERNQRVAEAARAKLSLTLKHTEASMAARRHENPDVARVLEEAERQAANSDTTEVGAKALSKLRDEVFDLGVKELSSNLQASWLYELEGADDELNMKLFDVQTYASDLDSVLAHFDASQSPSVSETEPTTAGQVAQEH